MTKGKTLYKFHSHAEVRSTSSAAYTHLAARKIVKRLVRREAMEANNRVLSLCWKPADIHCSDIHCSL